MATYRLKSGGREFDVSVQDDGRGGAEVTVDGETFQIEQIGGGPARVATSASTSAAAALAALVAASSAPITSTSAAGPGAITAPIPGVVTWLLVKVGDAVTAGQTVLKLEAMKMENDIATPIAGTVKEIAVSAGAQVSDGQLLVVIA